MKKVVMLNLSPRGKVSSSLKYLNMIQSLIENKNANQTIDTFSYSTIMNDDRKCYELFSSIASCNDCVIAFPLYVDTLPAIAQHFIETYYQFFIENNSSKTHNLYTIVNCGFPEPHQNRVALEIMKNFSKKTMFNSIYSLGIGMGPFLGNQPIHSIQSKYLAEKFSYIATSINHSEPITETSENLYVAAFFGPLNMWKNSIYNFIGTCNFKRYAKENKVKNLMYNQPYLN